jgi:hypothetical protein
MQVMFEFKNTFSQQQQPKKKKTHKEKSWPLFGKFILLFIYYIYFLQY